MKLIAAVDSKWAIGNNGDLLFRFPEDMRRFKDITMESKIVIMGRKTFESMNCKPLKDRINFVISRDPEFKYRYDSKNNIFVLNKCENIFPAITNALYPGDFSEEEMNKLCIIGGAQIYSFFLPYCSDAYITKIDSISKEADTYFPINLDENPDWTLKRSELGKECINIGYKYTFNHYENNNVKGQFYVDIKIGD